MLLTVNSLDSDRQNDIRVPEGEHELEGAGLKARDLSDKITHAFQLAMAQGPLCNEPVQGVAVFLEDVSISAQADDEGTSREVLGRLTGEVIKTMRESIRQGFLDWSPRLLLAMYSCEIQASSERTDITKWRSS